VQQLNYSAPEDPVQGSASLVAAAATIPVDQYTGDVPQPVLAEEPVQQQPVKVEKTPGRNDPCWCGSGKKFKLCHGR
jgi:uncharacterized protein YecA (UPF0149 family)